MTKLLNSLVLLLAVWVQPSYAADYILGIRFPYAEGKEECTNGERLKIQRYVESALVDSKVPSVAGWHVGVMDNGQEVDIEAIEEAGDDSIPGKRALQPSFCLTFLYKCIAGDVNSQYYCIMFENMCGYRRVLQVVDARELPAAVDEIQARVGIATTADGTITCVDTTAVEVIVEEF